MAGVASCVTDAFCNRVDSYTLTKPLIHHRYKGAEICSPFSVLRGSEDADLFIFGLFPTALNPCGMKRKSTSFSS